LKTCQVSEKIKSDEKIFESIPCGVTVSVTDLTGFQNLSGLHPHPKKLAESLILSPIRTDSEQNH
jgi:hypothetical protein